MYRTVIFVALTAAASAFAPSLGSGSIAIRQSQRAISHAGQLRMQDADAVAADDGAQPVATGGTQYATPGPVNRGLFAVFPTSRKSVVGDNAIVGDKGFDPLGFADSTNKLRIYREAELKHGRLAMLAALGWPVSEALDKPIAKLLGVSPLLTSTGEAPSVLNGGLENIPPLYFPAVFVMSALIEAYAARISKRAGFRATLAALGAEKLTGVDIDGDGQVGSPTMLDDGNYLPGDLGFDPLKLYKGSDQDKRTMQLKELNNGRLAMIAITGYAVSEFATKGTVLGGFSL
jgi:hypothetical protein